MLDQEKGEQQDRNVRHLVGLVPARRLPSVLEDEPVLPGLAGLRHDVSIHGNECGQSLRNGALLSSCERREHVGQISPVREKDVIFLDLVGPSHAIEVQMEQLKAVVRTVALYDVTAIRDKP